jgi:hypothetical protein
MAKIHGQSCRNVAIVSVGELMRICAQNTKKPFLLRNMCAKTGTIKHLILY